MIDNDTKRLSRLTAILTQLQTKRLLTAPKLAERFGVTVRTIYRDIKALEQAGVPIFTEEGKGYSLMEGYRIPPVMFTEKEANALITAEQLILTNKDASFVQDFMEAINKIRSVLPSSTRYKAELLSKHIVIKNNYEKDRSSRFLSLFQIALTNHNPVLIKYNSAENNEDSLRTIEPFFIYNSTTENWLIVAWCRLRNDFRAFRLDRILNVELLNERFQPRDMTIAKYFEGYKHP